MTITEQLEQARAELELEIVQSQLAAVRREKQLVDPWTRGLHAIAEGGMQRLEESGERFASLGGRLFDDPWFASDPQIFLGHQSQLDDRLDGKNRPVFENETDLAQIRGDCRILTDTNEVAIGVRRALVNFITGTGFLYTFSPKQDGDRSVSDLCQDWLDEFDERTGWQMLEREILERALTDGEPFVQLNHVGGGRCEPLIVEPDAITEPQGQGMASDQLGSHYGLNWGFGIATEYNRPDRPIAYFVDKTGSQLDTEIIPEHRMIHGKRNVVRNVKRGVSDFYPVVAELRRADKILRNTGEGAALQSAIAWIREHPLGTTGSQVLNLGRGKTEIEVDRPTAGGDSRTHRFQRYLPGTILDVRAGQIYKPGPMGEGNAFIDVSQAILRYVAVRWNMPEYLISADASNSNFASTLVVESPFVKAIQWEQQWFMSLVRQILWKMLAMAARQMKFAQFGIVRLDQLKERLNLNIQEPRVSVRNHLEETKINSVLHTYGLMSKETWTAREDLDFNHEQAKLAENPPMIPQQGLRGSELELGLNNKEFQPQANEPGNKGSMPEMGQKSRKTK